MMRRNFTPQLASAIQKHRIVCFIRYYESDYQGRKEAKCSIVKAYTIEEVAEIADAHAFQTDTNEQVFTPFTNKLLDSVASSSTTTVETYSSSKTKRALNFSTVAETDATSTSAQETPTKKQRDR